MGNESTTAGAFERETEAATVTRERDGLVVIRFREGAALRGEASRALVQAAIDAAEGRERGILVDLRGLRSASRAARQAPGAPEVGAVTRRAALLVGSPLTRVIATFYLRVVGPPYPARIFDDEAAARAWLCPGERARSEDEWPTRT